MQSSNNVYWTLTNSTYQVLDLGEHLQQQTQCHIHAYSEMQLDGWNLVLQSQKYDERG